jgi:hypothetical protein
MLKIVHSPLPAITPEVLPEELAGFVQRVFERPWACWWLVPTGRRRRALARDWLRMRDGHSSGRQASLLPELHTFESFVAQAMEYSARQRPRIAGPERHVRVARAWHEASGRTAGPGLVRQLDRFVRDWQACKLPMPGKPDLFTDVVRHYTEGLAADGRLDRMASVAALTEEVADPESWPNRLLFSRVELIVFDGFHRLERAELDLIAALSQRCDVLVWLVGVPGQVSWPTVETEINWLQSHGADPAILCVSDQPGPLAALGRSLFPSGEWRVASCKTPASFLTTRHWPLATLESADPTAEIEAVARSIKSDYLAAAKANQPFRLSDIAVVIPCPSYDAIIRETFPRAGLAFNLAGRALKVSQSRPARVLAAALELVRGQWRHDLLLDFLYQPLVKRRLERSYRLHELFEHRPRVRQQLNHMLWAASWDQHVQMLRDKIDRWNAGEPLPDWIATPRDEYVRMQAAAADELQELIASIKMVLAPVAALDKVPTAKAPMQELLKATVELMCTLKINDWLSPLSGWRGATGEWGEKMERLDHLQGATRYSPQPVVPWVELEKDQQAYYKLLAILEALQRLPENRLPLTADQRADALGAFLLALDAETYQITTEDDAGVQVFEIREIRGLRFRKVYVVGMVAGQVPLLPDEGVLADKRRHVPELNEQREQEQAEQAHLFSQVFEAAQEAVFLSRPTQDEDRITLPSPFLTAVKERVELPALPRAPVLVSLREAAERLGQAGAGGRAASLSLRDLWPGHESQGGTLESTLGALTAWQGRDGLPQRVAVTSLPLLRLRFPDDKPFSPSDLETYAACPFRYFGLRVLRLQERDADLTRAHYGSLIHRVLHQFYEERRRQFDGPADQPLPAIDTRGRAELLRLFDEEWNRLARGLLPPDLQDLFVHDQGVLRLFLVAIAPIEEKFGNLVNEFVLKDPQGAPILLGTDPKHHLPVWIAGKIDRVDVERVEITKAIILDYKTGKATLAGQFKLKIEDGRMLQLPLYGWCMEQAQPGLEVLGGAYVHLSEKVKVERQAILAVGTGLPGAKKGVHFDKSAARALALEMAGEIRDGNFPLTEHASGPHGECTPFCALRHACRQPDGYRERFED